MRSRTSYLNADLDLVSAEDLSALVSALDKGGVYPLHSERREDGLWFARLETRDQFEAPEPNIAAMLAVIGGLPTSLQTLWTGCSTRKLSIGYEGGAKPHALEQSISTELIDKMAALEISLEIVIYAPSGGSSEA